MKSQNMKKTKNTLQLRKETLRSLSESDLQTVVGAGISDVNPEASYCVCYTKGRCITNVPTFCYACEP